MSASFSLRTGVKYPVLREVQVTPGQPLRIRLHADGAEFAADDHEILELIADLQRDAELLRYALTLRHATPAEQDA